MKSQAFDKKSIAFDTKSNGNYKNSTIIQKKMAGKSIAFDKKSVAFDTNSNENYRKSIKNSIGNRHEINSMEITENRQEFNITR